MAMPDCEVIEKCIKDMLFSSIPNSSPILPVEAKTVTHSKSFVVNDRYFVSNIEENALSKPNNIPSLKNTDIQSNVSKLIDVNVLTDFAAKHIHETNLNATDLVLDCQNRVLPHPELEDNCPTAMSQEPKKNVLELFDNISNEIQNFPLFLNVSGNTLFTTGQSSVEDKTKNQLDKTMGKKERKKKRKPERIKELSGIKVLPKSSDASETSEEKEVSNENEAVKSLNKPTPKKKKKRIKKEETGIKLRRESSSILSSVGREYTLSFPRELIDCKFICHICNFTTEKNDHVHAHVKSRCHRRRKEENELDLMLPFLPKPLPDQVDALTNLINSIVEEVGLTENDVNVRKELMLRIKTLVEKHAPACSVDLVGSSSTSIGFKSSTVDISLKSSSDDNASMDLENIYEALSKDEAYTEVSGEFRQKRPCIIFIDKKTNLSCNLVLDNGNMAKLANLISFYVHFDKRIKPLGIAFRHWAKLCGIDKQDNGTLPSYCFTIILIYFLQQVTSPVLPAIEYEKFGQSYSSLLTKFQSEEEWCSENKDSLGELWVKLFHFCNFSYKIGEDVVCIGNSKKISCKDKNWSTKFYAIEDPFSRRNLGYVIPTYQVCHYIQQCFLRTYKYFSYPQLSCGSIKVKKNASYDTLMLAEYLEKNSLTKDTSEESVSEELSEKEESSAVDEIELEDHDPEISIENFISIVGNLSLDENNDAAIPELIQETENVDEISSLTKESKVSSALPSPEICGTEKSEKNSSNDNAFSDFCSWDISQKQQPLFDYKFEPKIFTGDKIIPVVCRACKSVGHAKKDCLHDELPPPCELPIMTPHSIRLVEKCLYYIAEKNKVTEVEIKKVREVMLEIQTSVQEVYPDAKLSLFGSFCNGFGFKTSSDMDFCLTFEDCTDKEELNSKEIIRKVAEQLNKCPILGNILPVTTAKVPIVKFTYTETDTEGDISLYNTLALANTEMLDAYSKIDERVQILGFNFKYFAKIIGICDASRGSLSSYAYLLMVIYFLQQRNPPVIPVLQELNNDEKKTEIIDGWNVWWCKDIDKLETIWPDFGKNKESVAELWVGLFTFYASEFNWKDYVVCIRQKELLKKFTKLWYSDKVAIEDPFDLKHNLGAGLTKKMNTYIFKSFHRARERFGTPIPHQRIQNITGREVAYFFERRFLSSGADPPHDRGCHKCGKIGHVAKSCNEEKCSYCSKMGHTSGKCPRKPKRGNEKRNIQDEPFDKRSTPEKKKVGGGQFRNQNAQSTGGKNSALHKLLNVTDKVDDHSRNPLLGVPCHRFPPGFNARPFLHPPPGFKPNILQSNFQHFGPQQPTQPFPKPVNRTDLPHSANHYSQIPPNAYSQSPPKQFSQSPPKSFFNHSPPKPFSSPQSFSGLNLYPTLTDPTWQENPRHPLQGVEHHPGVERHPLWQNMPSMNLMPNVRPKYGQNHHRRTLSSNNSPYSNQQ